MIKTGRETLIPAIESVMRKYKINRDIENIKSVAFMVLTKAAIDKTLNGKTYKELPPYFIFFAANQFEYPLQLGIIKRRMGKKFDLETFNTIQKVFFSLGYKRKSFSLLKYAENISNEPWFPVYMKETFMTMAGRLYKKNPRGVSPKKLVCAMINLSAIIHGRTYSYKRCCNFIKTERKMERAIAFVKKLLRDDYEWEKIINSTG